MSTAESCSYICIPTGCTRSLLNALILMLFFCTSLQDLKLFKKIIFDELGMDARRDVQIESLFMKIDSSCDGYIDWREFCHYMAVEMQEKEESRARQSSVSFPCQCVCRYGRYNLDN